MKIFLIPIFGMVFMLIGKFLYDFGGKMLRWYIKKTDETLSSFPESTQFGIFFFHCCVSLYAAFVLSLYAMAPVWSIPFLFLWCFFLISQ